MIIQIDTTVSKLVNGMRKPPSGLLYTLARLILMKRSMLTSGCVLVILRKLTVEPTFAMT